MKNTANKNRGRIGFIVAFATVTVLLSLFAVFYKLGYINLAEIGGYLNSFFERDFFDYKSDIL